MAEYIEGSNGVHFAQFNDLESAVVTKIIDRAINPMDRNTGGLLNHFLPRFARGQ